MTAQQFQELYKKDPSTAFAKFVQGLGGIQKAGGSATEVMQDLGLADERLLKAILPLAAGSEDLVNRLALARKEFSDPKRLDLEASKQFQTLASQLKMLANTFEAFFLVERDKSDGLRVFVQNLNEALQIILGFRQATDQTNPTVKLLVSLVKDFVAVLGVWAGLKIVSMLNDMRMQALGFAEAIGKGSILANPLLTAVLAVGVALSSWSIGKTLYDQFEFIQKAAENIRYAVNEAAIVGKAAAIQTASSSVNAGLGIFNSATFGFFRTNTPNTPSSVPKGTNSVLGQLLDQKKIHDLTMQQIEQDFKNGTNAGAGKSFGTEFKENFLNAVSDIQKAITPLLGGDQVKAAMADLRKQMEETTHAAQEGGQTGTQAYGSMHESLRKTVEQLEFEGKYLKLNNVDRQTTMTVDKMRAEIGEEINNKDEEALQILAKRIQLNARLNAEREIDQQLSSMKEELELGTLTGDQLQIESTYHQLINKYIQDGVNLTDEFKQGVHNTVTEVVKLRSAQENFRNFANDVGQAFGNAFDNATRQGANFKQVMLGLIQDVEQALIHNLVTTQIIKAVSGAVSGSGFLQGLFGATPPPTAHATGGWVTSPTFFNAGGNTHVAGEAGPEKITPANEYWGLVAAAQRGSGGSGKAGNTYINMTVVSQNADSFMKSKRQITAALKSGMR
jgi:hypothetical protein